MTLVLPPRRMAAIRRHAVREYPRECCGLLLGEDDGERGRVEVVLPAANVDPSPEHGYFIEPRDLLRGHRTARARGLRVIGYYHSHPDAPPDASARDQREALAGASYLIVGVAAGRAGEAWSFRRSGTDGALLREPLLAQEP